MHIHTDIHTYAHLQLPPPSPFHKHIHIYYFFYGKAEIAIYARSGCHISQQPNIVLHAHIFAMAMRYLQCALLCIQLVNWQQQQLG